MMRDIALGVEIGNILSFITFTIFAFLYNRYQKEWMFNWSVAYFVTFLLSAVFSVGLLFAYLCTQ